MTSSVTSFRNYVPQIRQNISDSNVSANDLKKMRDFISWINANESKFPQASKEMDAFKSAVHRVSKGGNISSAALTALQTTLNNLNTKLEAGIKILDQNKAQTTPKSHQHSPLSLPQAFDATHEPQQTVTDWVFSGPWYSQVGKGVAVVALSPLMILSGCGTVDPGLISTVNNIVNDINYYGGIYNKLTPPDQPKFNNIAPVGTKDAPPQGGKSYKVAANLDPATIQKNLQQLSVKQMQETSNSFKNYVEAARKEDQRYLAEVGKLDGTDPKYREKKTAIEEQHTKNRESIRIAYYKAGDEMTLRHQREFTDVAQGKPVPGAAIPKAPVKKL